MNSNESVRILQVTDMHLRADPDGELYGIRTNASFRAVMQRALADPQWRPDAILVTGDVAEDPVAPVYERFCAAVEPLGLPVRCLPGNHDDPALMTRLLGRAPVSYCAADTIGGWRLVLLDTVVPGEAGGALRDSELARLAHELAAAGNQWVLVAIHHQPLAIGSPWLDALGLRNGAALLAMLEAHPRARGVVWGHVHQESDRTRGTLRLLGTPSTCAQFTPRTARCVMDTRPPGFRRLELGADGTIRTEVVWLEDWAMRGRPPDSHADPDPINIG